jgi:hypothetical protein
MMVIVQAHNSEDWTKFADAFTANGFAFKVVHSVLAEVTYRNVTTQVQRTSTVVDGVWYNVVRLNPNKKWMKAIIEPKQVRYEIDFLKLIAELNFAANAKDTLQSNIKAIKFKMDLYKIFLMEYFNAPQTTIRVNMDTRMVDINIHYCGYPIMIKLQCNSNKEKSNLIENDMADYMGTIMFGPKILKNVNIKNILDNLSKSVLPVIKVKQEQSVEHRAQFNILQTKFNDDMNDLRTKFDKDCRSLRNQFPHLDDNSFSSIIEEGINKCQE